jgi:hypothetical protein
VGARGESRTSPAPWGRKTTLCSRSAHGRQDRIQFFSLATPIGAIHTHRGEPRRDPRGLFSPDTPRAARADTARAAAPLPRARVDDPAGYIGEFEIVDDHRASKIVVELNGRINKCGVISPRFDCPLTDIESWMNNLLPSRQFGHIVLSTTYGIMDHEEARRKRTGGKVIGFFY